MPTKNHRRFGIRHPLPFLKNAGVVAKDFSDDAAKKADDLAAKIFDPLHLLVGLFVPAATVGSPTSVTWNGFTLFYEAA